MKMTVFSKEMRYCESHGNIQTVHTTYAAARRTTTYLQTGCRKPYAETLTSIAPYDGCMRPKYVEQRILQ